jgi:PadR family transcriptional regulator PadR
MKDLSLYETVFLLAILHLKDRAYGVAIRERVSELAHRTLSYGTLYSYLDQLYRKDLVTKSRGNPTQERGGRSKIYYRVSPQGMRALKAAHKLHKSLWNSATETLLQRSWI